MAKKLILTLAVVVVFAAPSVSQAAFYDDIVAQIQSLLRQVASLQLQLNQYQGGSAVVVTDFESCVAAGNAVMESYPRQCRSADGRLFVEVIAGTTGAYGTASACPSLFRSLNRGSRGSDVQELQVFLRSTGDYTFPTITGYFGVATEQAVERYQARTGVVASGSAQMTGYGVVGPRTRSVIQQSCGGIMPPVNPPTDGAPYNCKVWYDGCNTCSRTYPGGPLMCTLRACIYQAPSYCQEYFDGGTTGNRPPVVHSFSGPTTLAINQTGTWSISASDPENSTLTYSINWGDAVFGPYPLGASADYSFRQTTTFQHAYSLAGTYTITMTVRDTSGQTTQTTTTVRVTGSGVSDIQFSVSPQSGAAPLTVTATVVVPPRSSGVYEICGPITIGTLYWGDGASQNVTRLGCSSQTVVTASHTYYNSGTYSATFTPSDGTQTQTRTVTVTGGTVCTMEYAPVCGVFRPNENICVDGTNYGYCSGETKTFSNMCHLNSDTLGFEFLHYGACGN
ncbi:MAG: PKD domain-containing protein [bacterium]|nr:PKD domain-containing protein [bacterium]